MKINKIREMSSPDLEKELGELKSELFKLRFSLATNGLDNPMKIREVKKDIAKIKTVLTERELKGEEPVVAEEPKKAEKKTASKAKKEQNLMTAFAGESQARNKYSYFASKAKKEATEGTEKKARKTTTKKESKAE